MTVKFKMPHERGATYRRELATGAILQGLSDGTVHLTFYRDVTLISAENFISDDAQPVPSKTPVAMRSDEPSVDQVSAREDVVTIIMPAASIAAFVEAIGRLPTLVGQLQEAINAHTLNKSASRE